MERTGGAELAAIPDVGSIAYACVWLPPPGLARHVAEPAGRSFRSAPVSITFVATRALPKGMPVVRIVDPT